MLVMNDKSHSHLYPIKAFSTLFSAKVGAQIKNVKAYRNSAAGDDHQYLAFPQPVAKFPLPTSQAEFDSLWESITKARGNEGNENIKTTRFSTADWDREGTCNWMT
jgi:hypothetical protein